MSGLTASKSFTPARRDSRVDQNAPDVRRAGKPSTAVSPLICLNLLCSDAPLVAISWQWLFARTVGRSVDFGGTCALLLTAWLIYLADRFGDSLSINLAAPTSLRQRFCLRHRAIWLSSVAIIAAADIYVISRWLDPRQLLAGAVVGLCTLVYLVLNQALPAVWRVLPIKEVSIGFMFAAGTVVAISNSVTRNTVPAWFLFGCLCSLNCICIAVWERGIDAAQQRISIATAFPGVSRYVLPTLALVVFASGALAIADLAARNIYLCIAISATLLAVVHCMRARIATDTRTALADLVLLTPIIVLALDLA